MKSPLLILLLNLFAADFVYPCSAIVLKNKTQLFLAKNFDWTYREGILIKNLRGTSKSAYFTHAGTPAQWISKYGSITFNQNGKEMPYGGMNEKGLVVEMLWLEVTRYNINDEKEYVNELEWIQYQLDNFETVQQVLDQLNDLKIYPIKGKIHYLLTDASGESVIIEYLSGNPIAYKKEANACQAITNGSVAYSESFKNQLRRIRKNNTAPSYRYYHLEQHISKIGNQPELTESYAFEILKSVTIPKGDFKTMWSIVYNVTEKKISFFTDSHKEIKTIHLAALDFDSALGYFSLNQSEQINLSNQLKAFTEPINHSYVSPSLIHLGFDERVTQDISQHQFLQGDQTTSVFANTYFHFEISVPLVEEKQTGFLAVMDSEQNFNSCQAVTGGYVYGNIAKGQLAIHIYGLKNGTYSMLAFIDDNKNRRLDFGKHGEAVEKYATFSNTLLTKEQQPNFFNTSGTFNKNNAKISVQWKK